MIFLLLLLTMTSSIVAYEQIYAINAGGKNHTDLDGIVYQEKTIVRSFDWSHKINLGFIQETDRELYNKVECLGKERNSDG
jgi:hypothetical protein